MSVYQYRMYVCLFTQCVWPGMKLFTTADDTISLQISQEKLTEVLPDGSACKGSDKCSSINVTGQNSWSPLVLETLETEVSTFKTWGTTFTVEEDGVTFNLLAHLTNEKTTVTDTVPCNGCANSTSTVTSGVCQATDLLCSAAIAGVDGAADTCATGYEFCTVSVEMEANELKFSMMITGWEFADPANKLSYGIIIKDKSGADGGDTSVPGVVTFGDGAVTYPTTGIVVGGADEEPRTVQVTTSSEQAKGGTVLSFEFEAFEKGETLYYDPTMGFGAAEGVKVGVAAVAVAIFAGFGLF